MLLVEANNFLSESQVMVQLCGIFYSENCDAILIYLRLGRPVSEAYPSQMPKFEVGYHAHLPMVLGQSFYERVFLADLKFLKEVLPLDEVVELVVQPQNLMNVFHRKCF